MPAAHVGAVRAAPRPVADDEHAWPFRFRRAHVSSSPDNRRWPAWSRARGQIQRFSNSSERNAR